METVGKGSAVKRHPLAELAEMRNASGMLKKYKQRGGEIFEKALEEVKMFHGLQAAPEVHSYNQVLIVIELKSRRYEICCCHLIGKLPPQAFSLGFEAGKCYFPILGG